MNERFRGMITQYQFIQLSIDTIKVIATFKPKEGSEAVVSEKEFTYLLLRGLKRVNKQVALSFRYEIELRCQGSTTIDSKGRGYFVSLVAPRS